MKNFLKESLEECIGKSYINSFPLEEFEDLKELEEFVKKSKAKGLGVHLKYETSNMHQGILVQVYDIKACRVKEYLDKG